MIVLLDLNYILTDKHPSDARKSPFINEVEDEQYRKWLIDLISHHKVILITARPGKYKEVTLKSIKEKIGWEPDDAYFNSFEDKMWYPPKIKKRILEEKIYPKYGKETLFVAIESNPRTRIMYDLEEINSLTINKD